MGAPGNEAARRAVRRITKARRDALDAAARVVAHRSDVVEHTRNRGNGDIRQTGDVANRGRATARTRRRTSSHLVRETALRLPDGNVYSRRANCQVGVTIR